MLIYILQRLMWHLLISQNVTFMIREIFTEYLVYTTDNLQNKDVVK